MEPCRKRPFQKFHTFRSDVSHPEAIATLYEEVTKISRAQHFDQQRRIMREINVHDKLEASKTSLERLKSIERANSLVKQFLPHLKTKSEAAIMNVSSGLAFVPLPISPGLIAPPRRSAFVHRVSACCN